MIRFGFLASSWPNMAQLATPERGLLNRHGELHPPGLVVEVLAPLRSVLSYPDELFSCSETFMSSCRICSVDPLSLSSPS